jgi:hypothetical protein
MNRAAAVSLALLFGSAVLAAQTAGQARSQVEREIVPGNDAGAANVAVLSSTLGKGVNKRSQTEIAIAQAAVSACPVALRAQQSAAAFTRQVDGTQQRGIAQRLHLSVTRSAGRRVASATVTVHGAGNKPRMVLTATAEGTADAAKSFDVTFVGEPESELAADLWVPGFSAVSSVEVNSVTYSDGSTWKLATGGSCSYPVDGLMLVK